MTDVRESVSENSRAAFDYLYSSGRMGQEQRFVYYKLRRYGPATGMELHRHLVLDEDDRESKIKGPERVRKRLPELEDLGLVMCIKGDAVCDVTGRRAKRYVAVEP